MFRVLEFWDYKNLNYNTFTGKTKPDFSHDICPITNYWLPFVNFFPTKRTVLPTTLENQHNLIMCSRRMMHWWNLHAETECLWWTTESIFLSSRYFFLVFYVVLCLKLKLDLVWSSRIFVMLRLNNWREIFKGLHCPCMGGAKWRRSSPHTLTHPPTASSKSMIRNRMGVFEGPVHWTPLTGCRLLH